MVWTTGISGHETQAGPFASTGIGLCSHGISLVLPACGGVQVPSLALNMLAP